MRATGPRTNGRMEAGHPARGDDRRDVGRAGEDAALTFYLHAGYRLLARNWRCPFGEIDLVLCRGRTIVFCEVKTRRGGDYGAPSDAVHRKKQRTLRTLAQAFLLGHRRDGLDELDVRFDVASVTIDRQGEASLHVFDDAI